MKRIIIVFLAIALLAGCGAITNAVYGPDMTPDQLKDAIYEDGYALGTIRASALAKDVSDAIKKKNLDTPQGEIIAAQTKALGEVIDRCEIVKTSTDPMSIISQRYYEELRKGDAQNAFIWFTARRVLGRIGINITDDGFKAIDFNKDQFINLVDAYETGVKDVMKELS